VIGLRLRQLVFASIIALIAYVFLANVMFPASMGMALDSYSLTIVGKYLCFAILAVALDLVWGYCGILSLGHAAFFSLGGYAMGMYLMRQIGERGTYGHPVLPDFMVFLNWEQLPWFWYGFDAFWFAGLMIFFAPGILAFVFGWFAFRSRVSGVYLSIITQALTYALMLAFFRNEMGFGGNNGLTDFKDLLGYPLTSDGVRVWLMLSSGLALLLSLFLCQKLLATKFGRVLVAVRDSESRTRFLGYRVEHFKLVAFVMSAMIAGLAGALYVPQVGIINPGEFSPLASIEVVVWVALGGRGSLYGAALGAIVVNAAKTFFTGFYPEAWLFFLGAMFVISTLYLPRGILGALEDLAQQVRGKAPKLSQEGLS